MAQSAEYDEEMFEKDTLIAESATDAAGYEDKADESVLANDKAVKKAESLLAEVAIPQVQSGGTQEGDPQWSAFKPQTNLAPILLDTGVSHLEVKKFVESSVLLASYVNQVFGSTLHPSSVQVGGLAWKAEKFRRNL